MKFFRVDLCFSLLKKHCLPVFMDVGSAGALLHLYIQKIEFLLQDIRHIILPSSEKEGIGKAVLIFQGENDEVSYL